MQQETPQHIGMVGILGTGMRAIAWLLKGQGHTVIGTDAQLDLSSPPAAMKDYTLHTPAIFIEHIPAFSSLIYSDSVPADHPARIAAQEHGVPTIPYQEALGTIASAYDTVIAVTGTHGKSSTTALLAHILIEAGIDPTVVVGALIPTWPGEHARLGKSGVFITEADEYREHFTTLKPTHTIITSVDFDHPDYFTDLAHVERAYTNLLKNMPSEGAVFTHKLVQDTHPGVAWPKTTIALTGDDWQGIAAPMPGEHMQQNAALAIELAHHAFSIDRETAAQSLQSFPGIGRRLERVGEIDKVPVFSDYGHHPVEIAATLQGIQNDTTRVLVVFEAHMRERLEHFLPDFAKALSSAPAVIIYPPFSPQGRETEGIAEHVESLENQLRSSNTDTYVLSDSTELDATLKRLAPDFTSIVAFSAGKLDSHLRKILST